MPLVLGDCVQKGRGCRPRQEGNDTWVWGLWFLVLSFFNLSPSTAALEEKEDVCSPHYLPGASVLRLAGDHTCRVMAVSPAYVSDGVLRLSVTQGRLLSQSLHLME